MSDYRAEYASITSRINDRANLLGVTRLNSLSKSRWNELREDATGISTLEVTSIAKELGMSIHYLIFGKEA